MSIASLPHEEINQLWFGGLDFDPERPFPNDAVQRWFRQSDEFDNKCKYVLMQAELISRPYEPLIRKIQELHATNLMALASSADKSLTLIILLDQISRNIMRGRDAEWVYTNGDPMALHVVHHCLRQGFDKELAPHQKMWYYIALGHSESPVDQELAVAKYAALACEIRGNEFKQWHPVFKTLLGYSIKYYNTIDQFGRFPHRNAVLNRESTEEELAFLAAGQGHA
jgi:uncharacterized protein (DUF924 family)